MYMKISLILLFLTLNSVLLGATFQNNLQIGLGSFSGTINYSFKNSKGELKGNTSISNTVLDIQYEKFFKKKFSLDLGVSGALPFIDQETKMFKVSIMPRFYLSPTGTVYQEETSSFKYQKKFRLAYYIAPTIDMLYTTYLLPTEVRGDIGLGIGLNAGVKYNLSSSYALQLSGQYSKMVGVESIGNFFNIVVGLVILL